MKLKWSDLENKILITNYQLNKKDILNLLPNRSPSAINIQASKLSLKKERNEYRNSKLDVLLEESHLSYYWVGFILADGSIVKNRLKVHLANKDSQHVMILSKFLNTKCKKDLMGYYISAQDKLIIPQLSKKFDIKKQKTYNPPTIFPTQIDKLLSLFIGYIDGDGCISKQFNRKDIIIRIKIHSSWLQWLTDIAKVLQQLVKEKLSLPYINSLGYCEWNICNKGLHQILKCHIIKNNLTVLIRKWNLIV